MPVLAVTLYTAHCTLHTAHCKLQTVHCKLHTAHCTLHAAHYILYIAHCTLHTAHYKLHTVNFTLQTAPCTLHTAHCTLHTARCTLHGGVSGECSVCRVGSLGVGQAHPRGSAARLSQPEAAPLPLSQSAPRKPCLPRVRSAVPQDRDQQRCMQPCGRGQIPQWRDQPSPGAVSVL